MSTSTYSISPTSTGVFVPHRVRASQKKRGKRRWQLIIKLDRGSVSFPSLTLSLSSLVVFAPVLHLSTRGGGSRLFP